MTRVGLIWAQTPAGVIGHAGTVPWRIPEDLARFRRITLGHAVIMGRHTWLSLPIRPLPERLNIVLSRDRALTAPGARVVGTVTEALSAAADHPPPAWMIGGAEVYATAAPLAALAEVTEVDLDLPGDTFAPPLSGDWRLAYTGVWQVSRTGTRYRFLRYTR